MLGRLFKYGSFWLAALSIFVSLACTFSGGTPTPNADGRIFTDDLGRSVVLPARIERAVSLAPSLTENIFAIGAGNRLVGVTTFCNYPAEALEIAKVGDTQTPNAETILALKPQVVFVSTASQLEEFTQKLAQQNIPVYVTNATDLDGVFRNLEQLGEIFETRTQADAVVARLKMRAESVSTSAAPRRPVRVFVQISKEPLYTVGGPTFITEIVRRAGGESVTADISKPYTVISKETALALAPEIIILSDSSDNQEPNGAFRDSPAVKSGRVYSINADKLSRPGPRLIDALEEIAGYLRR